MERCCLPKHQFKKKSETATLLQLSPWSIFRFIFSNCSNHICTPNWEALFFKMGFSMKRFLQPFLKNYLHPPLHVYLMVTICCYKSMKSVLPINTNSHKNKQQHHLYSDNLVGIVVEHLFQIIWKAFWLAGSLRKVGKTRLRATFQGMLSTWTMTF